MPVPFAIDKTKSRRSSDVNKKLARQGLPFLSLAFRSCARAPGRNGTSPCPLHASQLLHLQGQLCFFYRFLELLLPLQSSNKNQQNGKSCSLIVLQRLRFGQLFRQVLRLQTGHDTPVQHLCSRTCAQCPSPSDFEGACEF